MPVEFQTKDRLSSLIDASEIPSFCKDYLLPGFHSFYKTLDPGNLHKVSGYLTQEMKGIDFDICEYRFFIRGPLELTASSRQPLVTLVFILRGNLTGDLVGFGTIPFREGHSYLLYVPSKAKHEVKFAPDEYRVIHVNLYPSSLTHLSKKFKVLNVLMDLLAKNEVRGMLQKTIPFTPAARGELQRLLESGPQAKFTNGTMLRKVSSLFSQYFRGRAAKQSSTVAIRYSAESLEKIAQAKFIIDHWKGKPITHDELVRLLLLNAKVLKIGFKAMFQQPLYKYQLEQRLNKGRDLLLNTKLSIDEIARQCGYDDHSSFSKMFKAKFKYTPRDYRDKK